MAGPSAFRPPPFPHEHGAWAMLAMAPLLGLASVPAPSLAALLVFPGLFLLFLARYAALPAATRIVQGKARPPGFLARRLLWSAAYVAGAVACFWGALASTPAPSRPGALLSTTAVLGLGTVHAALALVGRDREAWAELLGMAGLGAAGPLVAFTAGGSSWAEAVPSLLLSFAYSASSLSWVRGYRASDRVPAFAVHGLLTAALAGAAALGRLAWPVAAVFLVAWCRLAWGFVSPPPNLRALGFRELSVAVAYLVLGMIAVRP